MSDEGMSDEVAVQAVSAEQVNQWTRHLWRVSQHNKMVIGLGGRVQAIVNEMREAADLPEFGWNTAFPDSEFGECTVHVADCGGQETHPEYRPEWADGKLREIDIPRLS